MKSKALKILKEAAYPVALVAITGLTWYVAALVAGSEFIIPMPSSALKTFFALFADATFYAAFGSTLLRSAIGFTVSLILAAVLAVLSAAFTPLKKLLSPLVSVCRALPTMAVVLLLVIWAGAKSAPVFVALLVIMPTLYSSIIGGIEGVDGKLVEMCAVYNVSRRDTIFKVYLPLTMPAVASPVAGALSLTVKLTVAAEVLANTAGSIGALMQTSRAYFETARLMALTIATVIVSLLLEFALKKLLELTYKKWKGAEKQ